jgi:RNA polymerase sigma-70 factor (ECF subfamily)
MSLNALIHRAREGGIEAYAGIVSSTQTMAYAVALGVVRDPALAQDAVQEAYLQAFRRLRDLDEPAAFLSWFRRIVITVALNTRRSRRHTWLRLDDVPEVPVLDESETEWSDEQRRQLACALMSLTPEERRLCDRRYHGQWDTARLAREAGVDESAMRKRLQRVRDKLRREIEMSEQRHIHPGTLPADLPAKVVELLARPRLTDLPDNPVGSVTDMLRAGFADFETVELPEVVDFAAAEQGIGRDALYIEAAELHRLDAARILRYDLTLPLLMTLKYEGRPLRVWASGKAYRACQLDATHLDAFHQAEVFQLDDRDRSDPWQLTGRVLRALQAVLPGRVMKIVPTHYVMCREAWDIEVEHHGRWCEVLAFGVFTDAIVRHVGGDPDRHVAMGLGCGLERLAMLRYDIDDIRKVETAHVA